MIILIKSSHSHFSKILPESPWSDSPDATGFCYEKIYIYIITDNNNNEFYLNTIQCSTKHSFLKVICLNVSSACKWVEGCVCVSVMRVWESYLNL